MSKRTLATIVAGLAAMPTLLLLAATPAAAAGSGSVQVSDARRCRPTSTPRARSASPVSTSRSR